ncbi:hypothetical protein CDAR_179141 [Caerostris darwini]|uniref:Uncharacterized protein n=1 Tax=Caerostris darwini TaxID=1538125 RepID=A0AAV4P9K2_9ARAC|nr:hypothetical protein CDAR_179141 [Caerostris darwini]
MNSTLLSIFVVVLMAAYVQCQGETCGTSECKEDEYCFKARFFSFLDHCTKYEKKGTFCSKDQKDRYICDPKLVCKKTSIFFYTCEDPDTTTTTTNTPPTETTSESTIEPETSPSE